LTPPAAPAGLELTARAKINLYLHVLGRRGDGYHELDSLVGFAELGDRLSLAPAPDVVLSIAGPFAHGLEAGSGNLVLKAARLLQARFEITKGAAISLEKRLPVAAGLGGGSADATAALVGLARLWGLAAGRKELAPLAPELGADVAACLAGRPAFMGGAGERLEPAPALPEMGAILANPGVPLATREVFAARSGPFSEPARFVGPVRSAEALVGLLKQRRNDLTEPALRLAPQIGEVLSSLEGVAGVMMARMSGSGATCFGLTRTPAEAERGAEALRARRPGWWVAATRLAPALPPGGKLG
jgi:4-diphosphocytidyl-2-C-methyl-D-erythritol kinase